MRNASQSILSSGRLCTEYRVLPTTALRGMTVARKSSQVRLQSIQGKKCGQEGEPHSALTQNTLTSQSIFSIGFRCPESTVLGPHALNDFQSQTFCVASSQQCPTTNRTSTTTRGFLRNKGYCLSARYANASLRRLQCAKVQAHAAVGYAGTYSNASHPCRHLQCKSSTHVVHLAEPP